MSHKRLYFQKWFNDLLELKWCTLHHVLVGTLSNGENVGRDFIPPLASVDSHGTERVNGVTLVRVDSDTEQAGVGLQ